MKQISILQGRRKGIQLNELTGVVITFAVVGLVLVFSSLIVQEVQDDVTGNTSAAYNATSETLDSFQTFSEWLPTLAIVIIASVIIFVLIRSFSGAV